MKRPAQPAEAGRRGSGVALLLILLCAMTLAAGADKSAEPKIKTEYLRQSIRLDFDHTLSRSANYLQAFDVFGNLAVVKAGWYGTAKNPDLLLVADLTSRKIRGPYRASERPDARRPNPLADFVAFGAGGREVLTGNDAEIRIHNLDTLHVEHRIAASELAPDSPFELWLSAAAITRDHSKLLLRAEERAGRRAPEDYQLRQRTRAYQTHFAVIDLASRAQLSRCSVRAMEGAAADLSPDGRLIAYAETRPGPGAAPEAPNVFVVRAADCAAVQSWTFGAEPFDVHFLPDSEHVAITFSSGAVKARVMQVAGGAERFRVPSPAESKFRKRLAVSSDGAWIATTGGVFGLMKPARLAEQLPANRAEVWSARSGAQRAIALVNYSDHTVATDSWDREIQFTPDSRYLVFPAADWSLRFFQLPGQAAARQ